MGKNRPVINNRKANHYYYVEDKIECGIVLHGNEVKSIIAGKCNINDAYGTIENGQLILRNMFISKYETANSFDVDETRDRVLLVQKCDIRHLSSKIAEQGMTLIPLQMYWKKQYCKVMLGVCKGKHTYDKRNDLKNRQIKRDIEREMKA